MHWNSLTPGNDFSRFDTLCSVASGCGNDGWTMQFGNSEIAGGCRTMVMFYTCHFRMVWNAKYRIFNEKINYKHESEKKEI